MSALAAQLERLGKWWRRKFGATIVPVVRLHGVISAEQRPGRINMQTFGPILERAFAVHKAPAIALIVNSPGGSPVQSRLISKLIRDLAKKHEKQVLVFLEDVAASGGYFIAVAGDEIIADPSSIVGSIGVIFSGFGLDEAMGKIGVSRRIYTAGKSKSTLDPFMPEKAEDVERIKKFEAEIHQVFIDHVKSRRAEKITLPDDEIYNGEFWSGIRGQELGLVDSLGDMHEVLRERFGDNVKVKLFEPKRGLLQLPRIGTALGGGALVSDVLASVEERALWSRFGR